MWLEALPSFVNTDAHTDHGHIITGCKKVSATAFLCVLEDLGSLALRSCTVVSVSEDYLTLK
jgi:vomeronasal 2 receptor